MGGSVREITERAKANQAAITYHFGGKEELYREVLRAAVHAFDELSLVDAASVAALGREEALRLFLRQQLLPLLRQGRLSRIVRLFQWEMLQRTSVFEAFVATEPLPAIDTADVIVRKFLPPSASGEDVAVARLWLFQQALIFIRNVEHLARPPLNLEVNEAFVERLIDRLGTLTLSGLGGLASPLAQGRSAASMLAPEGRAN